MKDKIFLSWLLNRLKFKYNEKDIQILDRVDSIINNRLIIDYSIDQNIIEKICKKYHQDWDFEKCELGFGHSDDSRQEIKNYTTNIIKDYINEICIAR